MAFSGLDYNNKQCIPCTLRVGTMCLLHHTGKVLSNTPVGLSLMTKMAGGI